MMRDRIMLSMYKSLARLGLNDRDNFRVEINRMRRAQNHAADYFADLIAEEKAQVDAFKKQLEPGNNPDELVSAPQKIADMPQMKQLIAPIQPQLARSEYGNFLNPAAIALSGITYWNDNDSENALVEFTKLYNAFPNSQLVCKLYVAALKRADRDIPEKLKDVQVEFTPGNAVYVFTAANRGPAYRQEELEIILPYAVIGLILAMLGSRHLNILQLGDDIAKGLGVNVEATRIILTAIGALLAASAVSVAGLLGFVGLIVPHTARLIIGSDYRFLVPASALLGIAVVTYSDTFSRVAFAPMELPVGIFMAILGAPFFLFLLRKEL